MYPVLGNIVLLGVAGCLRLRHAFGAAPMRALVLWGAGAALLVLLPWRLVEVETTVRPFAMAHRALLERPEKLLAIDILGVWYGADLIRNDPLFLHSPKVMRLMPGMERDPVFLEGLRRGEVGVVGQDELVSYGMTPTTVPR